MLCDVIDTASGIDVSRGLLHTEPVRADKCLEWAAGS